MLKSLRIRGIMVFGLAAAVVLLLGASSSVKADSISFTNQNGALGGYTSPYGSVDLSLSGDVITVTVLPGTGLFLHGDGFGMNTDLTSTEVSNLTVAVDCTDSQTFGGYSCSSTNYTTSFGKNFDGFGSFDWSVGGSGTGNTGFTKLVFTITGTNLSLSSFEDFSDTGNTADGGPAEFAAQVAAYNTTTLATYSSCTGYIAGGSNPSNPLTDGTTSPSGSCPGGTTVPEPNSLPLLGAGLAGLGLFGLIALKRDRSANVSQA